MVASGLDVTKKLQITEPKSLTRRHIRELHTHGSNPGIVDVPGIEGDRFGPDSAQGPDVSICLRWLGETWGTLMVATPADDLRR
ncbi:hypothetical protein [Rhodopseudomonas telluris]|uniref:Uncharacterized protein n=1 Tax=Rhodopseudomonas telluris TaxID=644215 RepID=A0ABV6EZU4_9BRAD